MKKKRIFIIIIILISVSLGALKLFTSCLGAPLMIYVETVKDDGGYKVGWQYVKNVKIVRQDFFQFTKAKPENLKYCNNLEEFYWFPTEEPDDLRFLPDADITNICLCANCKDLSDLLRFPNLKTLSLQDYKHDDLEYITELSCLKELDITSNNSIDISEIGKLSSLEKLFFYANTLDCNDLLGLDKLTYLGISAGENNNIENVESLLKLDSLKTVHVHSEDITEEDIQLLEEHGIEVQVD